MDENGVFGNYLSPVPGGPHFSSITAKDGIAGGLGGLHGRHFALFGNTGIVIEHDRQFTLLG